MRGWEGNETRFCPKQDYLLQWILPRKEKKKKKRARRLGRKEKIIFLTLAVGIRKETLLTG